jgi:glycerol kinase
MAKRFILAFDQGTTSSRSILFDASGKPVASASKEFPQIYPKPGWVEHDPEAIWQSQLETAKRVMADAKVSATDIAAIGITNQRETTVVWERNTGKPVFNAIVWQCRRTMDLCEQLTAAGLADEFRNRTGLVIDAYFSGTKVRWILDNNPSLRPRAERGELCFGTIDSWLLYRLTGAHATDTSNASRTLMFNIHALDWDDTLLNALKVPRAMLPQVKPTSAVYGSTTVLGGEIPVAAMCGDQQSALFGQTAFDPGDCKNTYGTGCFLLMNTGDKPVESTNGLLTTVAWTIGTKTVYALEGSVFIAGAVVQWLRDEIGLIRSAEESETLAASVEDSHGVYIVPAFVGLGAPHWDMRARGVITGLTRGAGRAHIVRAALESISFQSGDLIRCVEADAKIVVPRLKVDGGASRNNLLMQHQADVLSKPIVRGKVVETTALGAAYLAGLAVGVWRDARELATLWEPDRTFEPRWESEKRSSEVNNWQMAVKASKMR